MWKRKRNRFKIITSLTSPLLYFFLIHLGVFKKTFLLFMRTPKAEPPAEHARDILWQGYHLSNNVVWQCDAFHVVVTFIQITLSKRGVEIAALCLASGCYWDNSTARTYLNEASQTDRQKGQTRFYNWWLLFFIIIFPLNLLLISS